DKRDCPALGSIRHVLPAVSLSSRTCDKQIASPDKSRIILNAKNFKVGNIRLFDRRIEAVDECSEQHGDLHIPLKGARAETRPRTTVFATGKLTHPCP